MLSVNEDIWAYPSLSVELTELCLSLGSCWPAHPQGQEEGQGGHLQVHDSLPGPQPEDAGSVQSRKTPLTHCPSAPLLLGKGFLVLLA